MGSFNPNIWQSILSAMGIVQYTYIATLSNEITGTNPNTRILYAAMARLAGMLFMEEQLIKDIILQHIQQRREWAELLSKYEERELVHGLEELIRDGSIELNSEDKSRLLLLCGFYQAVTDYEIAKRSFVTFMENALKPRVIVLHEAALVMRDELVKTLADPLCCAYVGPHGKPLAFHELAGHIVKLALTPPMPAPDPSDTLKLNTLPVPKFEPIDAIHPHKHWLVTQMLEQTGYQLHPHFFKKEIHASSLHKSLTAQLGRTSGTVTVAEALNGLMRLQHGIMNDAHVAFQELANAHRTMELDPGRVLVKPMLDQSMRHRELEDIKDRLMEHILGLGKAPEERSDFQPSPGEKHRIQPPWMSTRI